MVFFFFVWIFSFVANHKSEEWIERLFNKIQYKELFKMLM